MFIDGQVYMAIRSMMQRGVEIPGIDFKKLRLNIGPPYSIPGSPTVYNVSYNQMLTKVQVVTNPVSHPTVFSSLTGQAGSKGDV